MTDELELKVIFLGDSLTQGWHVKKGFAHLLESSLIHHFPNKRVKCINKGVPGHTAEDGLNRIQKDVILENPGIVIIQFGINDAFTGFSLPEFRNNLKMIISIIRNESSAEPAIMTSSMTQDSLWDKRLLRFYGEIEDVAIETETHYIPVHMKWQEHINNKGSAEKYIQEDGIHPTELGHELISEIVKPHIIQFIDQL